MMFLLDSLITAPGKALFMLFKSLARKAQEEWLDEEPLKLELREIYSLLESGKITEREFESRESQLVERLEQIALVKSALQDAPEGELTSAEPGN
jgi:hypothetical protein